uniref:Uncharacterized protein n=1 Tax=Oryza sativa subsp. indica TaxID=39946 RepID=C5NNU8_ORYSI|nr:hypothetical protein [Oryza sativa Indica Group]
MAKDSWCSRCHLNSVAVQFSIQQDNSNNTLLALIDTEAAQIDNERRHMMSCSTRISADPNPERRIVGN